MKDAQKHYTGGEIKKARQSSSMGLIIRQKEPTNLETPFAQVYSFLTPTELFYIRSHFPAPKLDLASYQLRIDGAVRNPFSLSYKELRDMPSETRVATLECAGNGRVFLIPQVEGAQWELGAVGNAEWTRVPLGALLEGASMEEDACEIVLEGADQGIKSIEFITVNPKPDEQTLYSYQSWEGDPLAETSSKGASKRDARIDFILKQKASFMP
jgi:DMSO/TMAO reductase YedYZ molybdopterin-dependent catalytic subunit